MEATMYSLVSGVTHFYAPNAPMMRLKLFTCLSRNFSMAVLSLNEKYEDFLRENSVYPDDIFSLYLNGKCVWGDESIKKEVLENPDGCLESVCDIRFPEFSFEDCYADVSGEAKIDFLICTPDEYFGVCDSEEETENESESKEEKNNA